MVRRVRANNPTKATRHKANPVEVRNMAHPRVWALAMRLAGGDAKRVTVVSAGRVEVIVNEEEPKPEKAAAAQVVIPEAIPEPPPAKPAPRKRAAKVEPLFTDAEPT